MTIIDKNKILIELLDMICRKNKELYKEYCKFMFNKYDSLKDQQSPACTKKILKLIFKNKNINNLELRNIFFSTKKYKTFEELIEESFKYSKVKDKKDLKFLEVGFFIIRFMSHIEYELKMKSQKGKNIGR